MAAAARVALLSLLLSFSLYASALFNDQVLSPKASQLIETIAQELKDTTGMHGYVIATTEKLGRGKSLYAYLEKYQSQLSKPYTILMFVPNSKRIGILVSDPKLKAMYDADQVKRYAIGIIGSEDKNSLQSKYDVGVVQAFSELADEIAEHKGVQLKTTIKEKGHWVIALVSWAVYLGALLVFWVYFGRPIYKRIRYGKPQ